jgi:hypothetical protein
MPDLYIRIRRGTPVSLPSDDGLFIECKPLDVNHPAGRDYCDKGLKRFVIGDYAWAMPDALMVGYASSGYTLPTKFAEAVADRKTSLKTNGAVEACPDCSAEGYAQPPHFTVHDRNFNYPISSQKASPITIRHLWLNRS